MSDPMTNLDADDVLASIRRLVAETHTHAHTRGAEHRAEQVATPSKAMQQTPLTLDHPLTSPVESDETASAPAALVLTPDFRVEKPATVAVEEKTGEEGPSETPEPLVLSMEQAVHVPQNAPEQVPEEQAPEQISEAVIETLVAEEAQAASEPEIPSAPPADWSADLDDTPDEVAAAHVARLSLEQRIAELEAAVGAQSMEWEPDGSEGLEAEIPRAMPRAFTEPGARVLHFGPVETSKAVTPDADETASGQETDETYDDADGAAMTQAEDRVNDDMDEIADAEVIEETAYQPAQEASDEALPEDAAEREEAEIADAKIADAETEEDAEPAEGVAPDPDPSLEEELALAGYADEDILDEEALRDLVAQVIREELQGELGQRITRNVRRLVRREVQRALTLREFE
ncbi:hypothetical protein [uncultured Celeribacter sp.]|uniref:hypothetical protein n=1 Tax=uncultured Celeribacter sp. TaxID=1303376 RepID=UPI002AA83C39|nr:hypothetical protein [uncultured Celeribacter sp.]